MILILFEIMDIPFTNGMYKIYEDGRVFAKQKGIFLSNNINNRGYKQTCIIIFNNRRSIGIHQLLGEVYIKKPDNNEGLHLEIDHIDRNRLNNNLDNLRWVTKSENMVNRRMSGKVPYRHISIIGDNVKAYRIRITRNRQCIYVERFRQDNYTLEQVVNIRNEKYKELGIEIDDK